MSKPVTSEHGVSAPPILYSTIRDYHDPIDQFPLLGRRIISGLAQWGSSSSLKVPGEAIFIEGYWEWTEDILSHSGDILDACSLRSAVYASLYSYSRDSCIFRAFCEGWCPNTNTLHTITGEWSISLWDIHRIGGLPLLGEIYDETLPDLDTLYQENKNGDRFISKACDYLFMAYHCIAKRANSDGWVSAKQWIDFWFKKSKTYKAPNRRKRYINSRPKHSQDPSGNINTGATGSIVWTKEECDMFDSLGVVGSVRRETTYVAAFLSCWLCVFVLPSSQDKVIRPGTFETATLMARGVTFSLAVPVLASIYRGLNRIANSDSPSHSDCYFPAHYVYSWLAFYFKTHHDLETVPPGPPMVTYSGAQGSQYFHKDAARELIREGRGVNVGCTMLNKNRHEVLYDDGNLEPSKFGYLVSMRSSYLVLRQGRHFHVEPYMPHRFGRQFGFCQGVPGIFRRRHRDNKAKYLDALEYWHLLLYKGSQSRLFVPSHPLEWRYLTTKNFKAWWEKLTVTDLRENVNILSLATDTKSSKTLPAQASPGVQNVCQTKVNAILPENTNDNLGAHVSSTKGKSLQVRSTSRGCDSTSDAGSDVDFKHQRRGNKSSALTDREYANLDLDKFFDDVPELPIESHQVGGDLELEVTERINIDDSIVNEANQAQPLLGPLPNLRRGKELYVIRGSTDNNLPSPSTSHNTVEGPSALEVVAKHVRVESDPKSIPLIVHNASPDTPASTTQLTDTSRRIFNNTIKFFGIELLTTLKGTPFHQIPKMREEASNVYEGIRKLKGDPKPLKRLVDSYIVDVESYLKLKERMDAHPRLEQVEKARLSVDEEIKQFETGIDASLKKRKALEAEIEALHQKTEALQKELEEENNSYISLEAKVHAAKKRKEGLETTPSWSAEDIAGFEEHERQVLARQSSINPTTWMDTA